jgi:hypothetical protein
MTVEIKLSLTHRLILTQKKARAKRALNSAVQAIPLHAVL